MIYGRALTAKWTLEGAGNLLKQQAERGEWDGRDTPHGIRYLNSCKIMHLPTGSMAIFTKEHGYHSSGWWKNPDYERCYHLSLSFRDPITLEVAPLDKKLTKRWLEVLFGKNQNLIWTEPPYSADAKKRQVYHYRLFYTPGFLEPVKPRGEVYSRDWTPADWLSFSDLHEKLKEDADNHDPR